MFSHLRRDLAVDVAVVDNNTERSRELSVERSQIDDLTSH
eukprot:COSAG06_NODE_2600_length_6600_cov_1.974004_4_plen_40_part_00